MPEETAARYTVKPHVYPGRTVHTILDSKTERYIYGREDQALVEENCAALNRGEFVDLTRPPLPTLVLPKPKTKKGAQVTIDEMEENSP